MSKHGQLYNEWLTHNTMTDRYMSDHKDRMEHNTEVEEAVNRKIQRYAMAYEGILPQESIERSKQHWRNELLDFADEITATHHHQLQKARQDWLREEIVKLEGMKTSKLLLAQSLHNSMTGAIVNETVHTIIDRYQAELDQDNN